MTRLGISILLVLCFSATCDRGIIWNPDFHVGDYRMQGITNERQETTFCYEEKFNKFACLIEDKIKELREILAKARLPKETQMSVDKILGAIPFKAL